MLDFQTIISTLIGGVLGVAVGYATKEWVVNAFWLDPLAFVSSVVALLLFGMLLGMLPASTRRWRKAERKRIRELVRKVIDREGVIKAGDLPTEEEIERMMEEIFADDDAR